MIPQDEILLIKEHLKAVPLEIYQKHDETIIKTPSGNLSELTGFLYNDKNLNFKFLSNITCIDRQGTSNRFQLVYNLVNPDNYKTVEVVTYADDNNPPDSLTTLFKGANWHEREIYDMFGLPFKGHPDLRRILLPFNWKGHPLKKDYPIGGEEVTFSFSREFGKGKPVSEDELALWEEEDMLDAADEFSTTSASGFRKRDNPSTMVVNMGPQHPSTHGVLRLVLELDGEKIKKISPYIGYLHTGIEKNIENLTYQKALTLTDRMDYLSPLSNNLGYSLTVEKLLKLEIPPRARYIRVMLAELQRIASHLVWLATHALDIGVMSIFFYCFNAREEILSMFEQLSGVRLMTSYINIGGLRKDIPDGFLDRVNNFIRTFPDKIKEYETLLSKNKIWMDRTIGIGYISKEDTLNYGITGPMLRALGIEWDLRKIKPYSGYENFKFDVPVAKNGDVYDRYLVRIEEMKQSLEIIRQTVENLPGGEVTASNRKLIPPPKGELETSMEAVIHHFLLYGLGFTVPADETYFSIESPRGELGYYIVSDGSTKPYRVKVRAPSFVNLQALPEMGVGSLLADLVAIIGSIDPVMGEVDR